MADTVAVLDGLGITKAHVVGLSMGGFATLHLGLTHPGRALSLTVAGAGYGAKKQFKDYFRGVSREVARQLDLLAGAGTDDATSGLALIFSGDGLEDTRNILPNLTFSLNTLPPGEAQRALRRGDLGRAGPGLPLDG